MDRLNGKWVLISGASSGFVVHFAALLAARSANLFSWHDGESQRTNWRIPFTARVVCR